jgi:kynurenine 3-monooxygenase
MNAAFEDALVFDELFTQYNGDETRVLPEFNLIRVPTGHAIVELSQENYLEMRSKTANPVFVVKKRIEKVLHWLAPSYWVPQYTMVAFTRTPYHIAMQKGRRQDQILNAALLTAAVGVVGAALTALTYLPAVQQQVKQRQQRHQTRFPTARNYYTA